MLPRSPRGQLFQRQTVTCSWVMGSSSCIWPSFSPDGEPGISPDVSDEMSLRSSSGRSMIRGGYGEERRDDSRSMRCRLAGGISSDPSCSGRASRLPSRSSILTSSANSLEAWDESGEAESESAIVQTLVGELDLPMGPVGFIVLLVLGEMREWLRNEKKRMTERGMGRRRRPSLFVCSCLSLTLWICRLFRMTEFQSGFYAQLAAMGEKG